VTGTITYGAPETDIPPSAAAFAPQSTSINSSAYGEFSMVPAGKCAKIKMPIKKSSHNYQYRG
jgi:hypothetical protein